MAGPRKIPADADGFSIRPSTEPALNDVSATKGAGLDGLRAAACKLAIRPAPSGINAN